MLGTGYRVKGDRGPVLERPLCWWWSRRGNGSFSIHAHLCRGLRAGELASSGKEQLQLVFEMLEGDFASWRRNGVPVRPEFAQASSFGW